MGFIHGILIALLLISPSTFGKGIKYSENQVFSTRSFLFQSQTQPAIFFRDQLVASRADVFVHPAGNRSSVGVSATFSSFPIGIHARAMRLPQHSSTPYNRFSGEAGLFWWGGARSLVGQFGVSFIQEGLSDLDGRRFILPQITIRNLFTQGRIDATQHLSIAIPLSNQESHRLHTNHSAGYIFHLGKRLHLITGGSADLYMLLGNESAQIIFNDTDPGTTEREFLQILLGPSIALYHTSLGKLTVTAQQSALVSTNYANASDFTVRFFQYPAVNVVYDIGF